MRKKIVLIIIVLAFLLGITGVQAATDIYCIQLGVYDKEKAADLMIERMKKKGLETFKLSTSVHSVFYGSYTKRSDAVKDLPKVKKVMPSAFVTKLSAGQSLAYAKKEKAVAVASKNLVKTEDLAETVSKKISDPIGYSKADPKKQVVIKRTAEDNLKYTYKVMNDIELRGVNGESKWFFEVDKELTPKSFQLNLFSRVTELIRRDLSHVTIYMNNIPVKSIRFNGANKQLLYNWTIDVPADLINTGYNELKLVTYSRITDNACEDDRNIANWIILDGATNYVINYSKKYTHERIVDFPKSFIGMHADDDKGIGVVIPDSYTNEEISAALTLIAYLKNYESSYVNNMTLITSNDPALSEYNSLIYIGKYAGMPGLLKNLAKNDQSLYDSDVHLYRESLNNYRKPVFLMISNNGKSLMTGVKALKNKDIKEQMLNTHASLAQNFNIEVKDVEQDDYIYLTDMGLKGIEVKGRNEYTNIGFRIPYNKILADGASISLNLRYSDNLDFEKSMVSVYVNGVPIGSHKLDRGKRDLDSITFYIPKELRRSNYFDIRVGFELIPDGIIDCERYLASVSWAYIQEDSHIFVPSLDTPLMLLDYFPYPFSKNDDIDTTKIVLPDNPSRDDLKIAGIFAQLIGTGDKRNKGYIYAEKGNLFSERNSTDNLIIFGTPSENSAIKKVNKNLWFKFNEDFNRVLSNEKSELLPDFAETASFIELKTSPYNAKKGLLTVTSLHKEPLLNLLQYLQEHKMSSLTGDAVVVSQEGDFQTFRFQKEAERPFYENSILKNGNTRNYIIFAASTVLLMLVGLILYFNKNKKLK